MPIRSRRTGVAETLRFVRCIEKPCSRLGIFCGGEQSPSAQVQALDLKDDLKGGERI